MAAPGEPCERTVATEVRTPSPATDTADASAGNPPAPPPAAATRRRWAVWLFGLLALSALVLTVLEIGEIERFVELARRMEPVWLLAAVSLQAAIYVCTAAVWHRTLRRAGQGRRLAGLVPLGVAKLFTDQAVPSAGISGIVLVIRGLTRRGVPPRIGMAVVLVSLASFYAAYLLAVLVSLALLWVRHAMNAAVVGAAVALTVVAVAIPAGAYYLGRWGNRLPPRLLKRAPNLVWLLRAIAEAPSDPFRSPVLVAEAIALQVLVFVLDAATLWVMLRAVGQDASPAVVFPSFVMASVAANLGPIPLGLGTFEAVSVLMLRAASVPVEAALTSTLLLRGFTTWLPMLPGLWLARREIHGARDVGGMAEHDMPLKDDRAPDRSVLENRPVAEILADLGTTPAGLGTAEAEARLARYGPNEAAVVARRPAWLRFLSRFGNPLIIILLVASALSAATGDVPSFVIVVTIIMLSVVLDFVQETRAESAVEALRRSVALRATVRRDGAEASVPAARLVPGDVVRLVAGDLVPADCRLIEAKDLFVNQALLTGEPYPAEKHAADPAGQAGGDLAGGTNAVFMGTSVISGTATAVVCLTGGATALGGLAGTLGAKPPTAFEIGIRRFGLLILRLTVLLVLFVLVANVAFHRPWLDSIMFALALAVGLTPELLPMVVTVTLARGAMRLAGRRVIAKRPAVMHNLGAMDVLCTDKTGTLTEATIRLVGHVDAAGAESDRVFELAYLNSHFETGIKSPLDDAVVAHRALDVGAWRKLDEVPFDFERRRVSVLVARGDRRLLVVKGAPEDVLRLSSRYEAGGGERPLDAEARAALVAAFERLGDEGYRALGIASREVGPEHATASTGDEANLVFAGFVTFLDPPKADAAAAVHALAGAGVGVVILTGDNERVTRHVCAELDVPVAGIVTGDELARMTEEALLGRLPSANVFCRVSPQQKLRVLLALKRGGRVVGYLGDGINDAPALHAADVGISVDTAADVAKEAAEVVLLDRDLSVIVDAVGEGRAAVVNVAKYILMGSSSNFGNMFSMAGAALFLPFLPMLPTQVLLNNLLYDASEVGIPFDRVDPETIARPVHWDLRLIERFMFVMGPLSSVFDFVTFFALLHLFAADEALFHTGWFIESLATQVLVIFAIRTRRRLFASRPHRLLAGLAIGVVALGVALPLTPVGAWFGFVVPPPGYFLFLIAATGAYIALVEAVKPVFYRRFGRAGERATPGPRPA